MKSMKSTISRQRAGGLIVIALTVIFSTAPAISLASHIPNPCASVSTAGDLNTVDGLYVPVREFTLEKINRAIAIDANAAAFYLNLLCDKEYVADHNLQHAWAQTIGSFVEWTVKFINTGYAGNPLYVSDPYLYYLRVDNDVFQTLYDEIRTSPAIPNSLKIPLLRNLALKRSDRLFPELIEPDVEDEEVEKLIRNFTDGGGWDMWLNIVTDPVEQLPNLIILADTELAQRRANARTIEAEKLAWGRGFFSLEECDLTVWTLGNQDRRNCRIFTPGSLIQEQATLVLGSALRQMELADEYEEFISLGAFNAMNAVLNNAGIRRNTLINSTAVVPPIPGGIIPFTGARPTTDPPRVGFLKIDEGLEGSDATESSIPDIFQQPNYEKKFIFESPF